MARRDAIAALGAALAAATAARDWEQLDNAARTLVPQLEALRTRGPWSAAEQDALARLRTAHEQAAQACAEQEAALEQRMSEMRANKAGWIAYTLDSATETDENQA